MDIKIGLEIGLSPALEGFLGKFLGGAQPAPETSTVEYVVRAVDEAAPETTVAQDPQAEAPRRQRRTKAQMEADAATAQPTNSENSSDEQVQPVPGASLADALEAAEKPARQGVTTKADVAAKMMELAGTPGWSPKKVQDQMKEHLNGATNMSTLAEADYDKALALFDRLMAEA